MAKGTPDATAAPGERLLGEWGIGSDATPAHLASVIGRDLTADLAIAHRLGGIVSMESAALLQRLEDETADKHVRKEAKRARYRLQQRGVTMPERAAAAAPAPAIAPAIEGYMSPVDGRGDQLVWLVKAQPGGVAHLFAIINDPEGLRETALNVVTRKTLKTAREELERKHELRMVPVDWTHADFIVHRAFEWARARGTRMEGDYPGLRAQLTRHPAPQSMPALSPLEAMRNDDEGSPIDGSADLLTEPEFRTWFFIESELRADVEELAAAKDSPLVLNPAQQRERFDAVIVRATDRIFGGDQRHSWARRLIEMALYFAASRRPQRAQQALAVARALEGDGAAHAIPFCDALVRTSLGYLFQLSVEQDKEREKSSLVLTPQQVARQERR